MPFMAEGTLELSGTTAILLVFQADDQLKKITDIYVGLVVHCIESHLYAPEKILDFVSDIEVDLKAANNALKAGGHLGKRCTHAAGHHSIHSQATENGEVSSSESDSSQDEGVGAEEEDNAEEGKSGIETSSDEQEASDGEDQQECPHTQDTLTGVSQHEDTNPESDSGEKVQTAWQNQHKDSPTKNSSGSLSSEEEPRTNEVL